MSMDNPQYKPDPYERGNALMGAAMQRQQGTESPEYREKRLSRDPWEHRGMNMRCRTCMFFVEKVVANESCIRVNPLGRCRRHAPTMSGYPAVYADDWCGDHKVDETK